MALVTSLIVQYFLNDTLDPEELERQVAEFAAAGYQGVYPHARAGLTTPYMSATWWSAVDTILAACRRHGLEMWLWDEDYYPSGLAGGRIVWEEPGLIARGLEFSVTRHEGPGPLEADFAPGLLLRAFAVAERDGRLGEPIDVTEWCGTRRQKWGPRYQLHRAYSPLISEVGHPHWRTSFGDNRFALVWDPPEPGPWVVVGVTIKNGGGVHPDILRPEGIARFLELSHAAYLERYPDAFGREIRAAFTDEPSPGVGPFPWTAAFAAAFAADHGYDLLPHLAHLALDLDGRSPVVRHHYRLTQHRLQCACYVDQIASWCERHQIAMTGHLTRTEWLSLVAAWWPNELRCYRAMPIPAADPLGGSLGWPASAAYHTGLKVVSSAAHLFGRQQASSDALAVIGDEARLRDLKFILDYHLVLGVNHFTLHGASYSFDGPRKDEVPPSLGRQHTQFKHFRTLFDRVRETAEALTGGEHLCRVALLYPSTSLGCQVLPGQDYPCLADEPRIHDLVERLLSRQCDFDFIDEVTLAECVTSDGRLTCPEPYQTIVLPHLRYLGQPAAAALVRFARAGGRVLAVGGLPVALPAELAEPVTDWHQGLIDTVAAEALPGDLPRADLAGDGAEDVFVLRRRRDGEELAFLLNRAETEFAGTLAGRPVTLAPRGSRLLRAGDRAEPAVGEPVADLSGDWSVAFEPNQLPLSFWHVQSPAGRRPEPGGIGALPGYDLMRRESDPAQGDAPVGYYCRFMLAGAVPDAVLLLDPATIAGEWRLTVNGTAVTDWRRTRRFDARNLEAEVGPLLRGGSNPTLNVVGVEASGPGRGLREVPYLLGSFTAEYRYGNLSFPFLRGGAARSVPVLQTWDALGYPTFSGSASYRRQVTVPAAGEYWLDLGRVEDVAAVALDGAPVAVLGWPPYRCRLAIDRPGAHELAIEVTNPPANRSRAARLPAGLLGPVRLHRAHG